MPKSDSSHLRAVGAAVFVTMLWSSSWILIRVGLDDEDLAPLTFAGLRYTLAAALVAGWAMSRREHRQQVASIERAMWKRLVVLGVVFFTITQGAQFMAIDNQPAATASLILAPTAFAVALFSGRSLGERSSRRQYAGAACVAIGAGVYFAGDLGATVVGMISSVVGLAANVSGSLLGRSVNRTSTMPPTVITAVSMTVGAVLLLVVGLLVEGMPDLTTRLVVIIGWLAIANTAFAFTLWNWSLRHLAAVESAAINNTMLIQIAALAWIFLGEGPGIAGIAGILIVSLGAFLTTSAPRTRHH